MSAATRVAVVVVSFEARDTLVAGLATFERNAGIAVETVVVDNANSDGSVEAVRASHPGARVLSRTPRTSASPAPATRAGARAARRSCCS